jgi:hypothetical protein
MLPTRRLVHDGGPGQRYRFESPESVGFHERAKETTGNRGAAGPASHELGGSPYGLLSGPAAWSTAAGGALEPGRTALEGLSPWVTRRSFALKAELTTIWGWRCHVK